MADEVPKTSSGAYEQAYTSRVTKDQIWQGVSAYLRSEFGKMVQPRSMRRVRKVAGDGYVISIVAVSANGDVPIADVEIDEEGVMSPAIGPDEVIEALRRPPVDLEASGPSSIDAFFGDLVDEAPGDGSPDDLDRIQAQVTQLLAKGDTASLLQARSLMPRLLPDPDLRGPVLLKLAGLEFKLGERQTALDHIEAAAKEFADRFDVDSLEKSAALSQQIQSPEEYAKSTVHRVLAQSRVRLQPLSAIFEAGPLSTLSESEREWLEKNMELLTLSPGEFLVREGEASKRVFVIKSGLIGVLLEKTGGGYRTVRSCFPGWLLGENSVLTPGDPRTSASLRAERVSEVWAIDADVLLTVMEKNDGLAERIAATKQIHRIDSYFSMHETMSQLDVQVRDEMLGCISRIQTFEENAILVKVGQLPPAACLVARGEITVFGGEDFSVEPLAVVAPDSFFGVRDVLHEIPSGVTAIIRAGSTIAFFDANRLRELAKKSPEHVVAVLERLG